MQVGLFSDTFFPVVDGVGRVVYSYANTIAKKGHECYVVAPMANTGYRGGYPFELVEFISLGVPGQRQYNTGIPQLDPHYDVRMSKVKLDVVHAHSPFVAGQEALRLARKRSIPLIGTFHSKYYDDFYKLTRSEMLADAGVRYIVNFYDKCDEVWAVSDGSSDVLHDYGYQGDIVVMPNGTPDTVPCEADRLAAIERFHLIDDPILLYCGQINWKKNLLRVLEASARLKNQGLRFQLVLAGQGPDRKAVAERADALGLADRILFTGHLTEDRILNGLYQAASVFVFPSLYDTSGMVVREAASQKTASVVVRGSAAAEPIRNGVNGLLCEDDSENLADVLLTALEKPGFLKSLGEEARKTIYISWDKLLDDVLGRYQMLIDQKKFGFI